MTEQTRMVLPGQPVPGQPARCRACGVRMSQADVPTGPWRAVGTPVGTPVPDADHDHVAVGGAWLDQWAGMYADDPVAALLSLVDEYGVERATETLMAGEAAGDTRADETAARARAVRAQLAALLGDPAGLRNVADLVERERLGHVTDIAGPDIAGHFEWSCIQGDADQTGMETAEEAYQAATAHGPLTATSPFARRPPIVHDQLARNRAGVPRRSLGRSLFYSPYDGGEWKFVGYGETTDVDEGDVAGAQAWAAAHLDSIDYDNGRSGRDRTVRRWEHHQDPHGEWWEPVYDDDQDQDQVIRHRGQAVDSLGVPLRDGTGVLRWQDFQTGGVWQLNGYMFSSDFGQDDVDGVLAWAQRQIRAGTETRLPREVLRWEHHRDDFGGWWAPTIGRMR
jgi:hypothetical protein